jgi:hypothetical protein
MSGTNDERCKFSAPDASTLSFRSTSSSHSGSSDTRDFRHARDDEMSKSPTEKPDPTTRPEGAAEIVEAIHYTAQNPATEWIDDVGEYPASERDRPQLSAHAPLSSLAPTRAALANSLETQTTLPIGLLQEKQPCAGHDRTGIKILPIPPVAVSARDVEACTTTTSYSTRSFAPTDAPGAAKDAPDNFFVRLAVRSGMPHTASPLPIGWLYLSFLLGALVGIAPRCLVLLVSHIVPAVDMYAAPDLFKELWAPCKEPTRTWSGFSPGV